MLGAHTGVMPHPYGWRVIHEDRLIYESSGNVRLTIKVQSYAEYRQIVKVLFIPDGFKMRRKSMNRFLIFNGIVSKKGSISLRREYEIYPVQVYFPPEFDWGKISEIPEKMRGKYIPSGKFWNAKIMEDLKKEKWFSGDSLNDWIQNAVKFLRRRIKYAEPLEERLGAEKAYRQRMEDCDEFTDLLVTIARMRGLPARRLTGFYMREKEEPHAWAEVYSPRGQWIPVDAALLRIGDHSRYIVMKVEEFNPSIGEYRLLWKGGQFRYRIERNVIVREIR